MSIIIRPCEHSAETSSRDYYKNPDLCATCTYEAKHGPPKRLHVAKHSPEMRLLASERMKKAWKAKKAAQALK